MQTAPTPFLVAGSKVFSTQWVAGKCPRILTTIFCILVLLPSILIAQTLAGIEGVADEIRIANGSLGIGVRALGMGGAHIAASDDFSASFYNPANLSFMKRPEISGALSHSMIGNETTLNSIFSTRDRSKTRLEYLGGVLVLPTVRGGASLAIGGGRLYPFDGVFYAKDSTQQMLELSSGGVCGINLAGAVQVARGLGIGLSVQLLNGEENYSWDLERNFPSGNLEKLIISDNIKYDYGGVGVKIGLTYSPYSFIRFSGTVDFPRSITINEDGTARVESLFVEGSSYNEESGVVEEYSLSYPFTFGLGANLNLMFLNLAIDAIYTDWRQLEYRSPDWILSENKYLETSYRSTWSYKAGVEGIVPVIGLTLRAGYAKMPLPYTGREISDDREYLTLGGGILIARLIALDFAFLLSDWERRSSGIELSERYKLTQLVMGLSYRF